jgi:hypothetical protein
VAVAVQHGAQGEADEAQAQVSEEGAAVNGAAAAISVHGKSSTGHCMFGAGRYSLIFPVNHQSKYFSRDGATQVRLSSS